MTTVNQAITLALSIVIKQNNNWFSVSSVFIFIGFCYSTDILASHHVDSLLDCGQLSLQSETCVGFKYRPGNDNQPNCVNFKKIENCLESAPTSNGNADWKYFKAVHKQVRKDQ